MIAKLTLPSGAVATLDDAGVWSCPDIPSLAETLNLIDEYSPPKSHSPALGAFGAFQATAAHKAFGGALWMREFPAGPAGRVY